MTKQCAHCGTVFPIAAFTRDKYKPDGLNCRCRTCVNESSARYKAANLDAVRARAAASERARRVERNARKRALYAAWRTANPLPEPVTEPAPESKQCTKCGVVKAMGAFAKDKAAKFGVKSYCNSCASKLNSEWLKRSGNRARYNREFRARHPEETKARSAAYQQKNKDAIRVRNRMYHLKNKVRRNEASKADYKNNKADRDAAIKRWRSENRHTLYALNARYRALKRGAKVGNTRVITAWRKSWMKKKSVTCYWCQGSFAPTECHVDHVVALKNGGAHEIGNLCIACASCNTSKRSKTVAQVSATLQQPVLL